jgi:hypothetical protein
MKRQIEIGKNAFAIIVDGERVQYHGAKGKFEEATEHDKRNLKLMQSLHHIITGKADSAIVDAFGAIISACLIEMMQEVAKEMTKGKGNITTTIGNA